MDRRNSLLALILCLSCHSFFSPCFAQTVSWPQWGLNNDNTRYNSQETTINTGNVGNLGVVQQVELPLENLGDGDAPPSIYSSPANVSGVAYFGDLDGNFYGVNSAGIEWVFHTGPYPPPNYCVAQITGSPVVANGMVYFGTLPSCITTLFDTMFGLNASTGALVWSRMANGGLEASPIVIGNAVYFADTGGYVWALDGATGAVLWSYFVNDNAETTAINLAADSGNIYVAGSGGMIYELNASTGSLVATFANITLAGHGIGSSSPSISNGALYMGDNAGNVWDLNLSNGTGKVLYTPGDGDAINTGFAIANGAVFFCSANGSIYSINLASGALNWSEQIGADWSTPAVANGVVYVGTTSGEVYALNASTGATLWSYSTGRNILSSLVIADGNLLLTSTNGNYYVFGLGSSNSHPTTTALVSSPNPSQNGQSVTFTATVTPTRDGGTVTFTYGATTLCSGVALSKGVASCAYAALPPGTDTVTAAYSGDTNYGASSGTVAQTVNTGTATKTTLRASPNPSQYNQSVAFTATVTPTPDGGTVTFTYGVTTLCNGVALTKGVASCAYAALPPGTDTVTAAYGGDLNFGASSGTVAQRVNATPTTTTLVSSPNPSAYGEPVQLTATVSSADGTPTGTVTFKSGTTTLGSAALNGGTAQLTNTKIALGSDSLTATYNGSSSYTKSTSPAVLQTVNQAALSMKLTSSPNPSKSGQAVRLTATVSSNGGIPTGGTVTFTYGTTTLGTGKMTSKGVATLSTTLLPVGADVVTASYAGNADYSSASATVTQTVN